MTEAGVAAEAEAVSVRVTDLTINSSSGSLIQTITNVVITGMETMAAGLLLVLTDNGKRPQVTAEKGMGWTDSITDQGPRSKIIMMITAGTTDHQIMIGLIVTKSAVVARVTATA